MIIETQDIILACIAAIMAGFVDAVVGGGGLIQAPVLFILFPHFLVPQVIGTNRFASFMGTAVAGYQYAKSVSIPWRVVLYAGLGAAVMAYLGAKISSLISAEILKPIILILIILIAIYTFKKKTFGQSDNLHISLEKVPFYGLLIGSITGFYNGFVGPGTGSLLVFGFVSIIGYSFLKASAISKITNATADIASLIFFVINGYIVFKLAIPMMICNMVGGYAGSRMAILRGNEFVRKFFLFVIFALILRFGYDVLIRFK
jgi:uncharacterized protein